MAGIGNCQAQTYSIKVSDLDSLLWMAAKYKAADSALNTATASIQALRQSISEKTDVVLLQGEQLKNYLKLIDALKATITNERELGVLDRQKLKKQKNKWVKVSIGSWLAVAVLVVLML